jgi:hypothetical protein
VNHAPSAVAKAFFNTLLKGELSDIMAKYMADELLVRTFEDSSE